MPPNANWIYNDNENRYWPRVLLNDAAVNPVMGKDFTSIIFDIERRGNEYYINLKNNGSPKVIGANRAKQFMSSFPVYSGSDHPNEISAYMYSEYFKAMIANKTPFLTIRESARLNAELFINWLSKKENVSHSLINN